MTRTDRLPSLQALLRAGAGPLDTELHAHIRNLKDCISGLCVEMLDKDNAARARMMGYVMCITELYDTLRSIEDELLRSPADE